MAGYQPYEGQTGTAPDGTRIVFRGGKVYPLEQDPGGASGGGGEGALPATSYGNRLRNSGDYRKKAAQGLAAQDIKAQDRIDAGLQDAEAARMQLGNLREDLRQAPTGSFAGVRQSLGKNFGNVLGGLPFIPTYEEAAALENLRTDTAERTLGDVSKLKGPLSDKDVQFLSRLQVDPYASKAHNQYVANMQDWANRRRQQYYEGMQAWVNRLGSPNATNGRGENYQQWWSKWSEENIRRPDTRMPSRREQQNQTLKSQSAKAAPGGVRVLSVDN